MSDASVSLIIVSRHRTASLLRTITAVRLQDHVALELIVVADPEAASAVRALDLPIKLLVFDAANISAARNAGLAESAGDLVAFLDDDAIPEPTWITRLSAAFENPDVRLATGFVRGRNGISDQWRACDVDQFGWDHPLAVDRHAVTLLAGAPSRTVKAQGTNCMFRRGDLLALGGFDGGIRFYLDDADISLRLAALGGLTAVVPMAVVQHAFAGSDRRRADRVPLSLHDIGASVAYFLRRHAPVADVTDQRDAQAHAQRTRLLRHMVDGGLEPRDLAPLMASFEEGWREGAERKMIALLPMANLPREFMLFGTRPRAGVTIAGRLWQRRSLIGKARVEAAAGKIVTLICFSPNAWYHKHWFESDGFWMQQGGVLGRTVRDGPLIEMKGYAARVQQETARIGKTRPN